MTKKVLSFLLIMIIFATIIVHTNEAEIYNNPVKSALKQGKAVFGGFLTIPDPAIAENFALSGKLDFVWIEAEHTVMSLNDIQNITRALDNRNYPLAPIVRVPHNHIDTVKRYLGIGVKGIIFPTINNAIEARYAVSCTKYAPEGIRPAGVERANGYLENFGPYIKNANEQIMAILMIETKEGCENIEEIMSVKGIDVLHLGPYDMSLSYSNALNKPVNSKEVKNAVKKAVAHIEKLALENDIVLGSYAPDLKTAHKKIIKGYRFFSVPDDAALIRNGLKQYFNKEARTEIFNQNEILSFVYSWFTLFDRQKSVKQFLNVITDKGLEMKFPETTLKSHADFIKWYTGILKSIKHNTHDIENIQIKQISEKQFSVSLDVNWNAVTFKGKRLGMKVHQYWLLEDRGGETPIITSYNVRVIK